MVIAYYLEVENGSAVERKGEKEIMKRRRVWNRIAAVLVLSIFAVYTAMSAYAYTLNCWFSNDIEDRVGTRDGLIIKFSQQKLNTNNNFEFYAGCLYAKNQWKPKLGISYTDVVLMSRANLKVYGGTISELSKVNIKVGSGANGITVDSGTPQTIQWANYNGHDYNIVRCVPTITGIIDKGNSSAKLRNTCTHEMGHALGWYGHYWASGAVMSEMENTVQDLTPNDINQLKQVY